MRTRMLKRAETSGRVDDTLEIFQKRLQDFQEESEPIISFYEKEGLYRMVSAHPVRRSSSNVA